jgi:hypothetical protein
MSRSHGVKDTQNFRVCNGSQHCQDERDTIFHEYFPQTDNVDPNAPPANPAAPAEKKKAWNLNWGPLSWMADMSAQ